MKRLSCRTVRHVILVLCVLSLGVLCCGEAESDAAPMEKGEQEGLYSAIQGFVGKWWNGSDLYPDPCGWTPIQGVACDIFKGLWYVTDLSIGPIHDNSLDCAINPEFRPQLFQLKHLKTLSFFNCFMSPFKHPITIPTKNWEKLAANLEKLEFRSNPGLIGQIPVSFGGLVKLQSLVLLENGLTGELLINFGKLENLKRLVLAGNQISGKIPDSFGGLSQLLIMDLSRNSLSGSLPYSLGGLSSLLKLDLSNNQLDGNLPSEIGYLRNLTLLDLRNNKFSGGLVKSLEKIESLEEIALSNNPIHGNLHVIEWKKLQNLVILDLANMGLTGEIPGSISELKKLRFLGLGNNNLTGFISPKLAKLPCVSAMYLNGNNLTGILQFSKEFYKSLGRRFGAWNNPNLCFPFGLISATHVPYGVKPCQQGLTLLEPSSNSKVDSDKLNQSSHLVMSLGFSRNGINEFWGVFMVQILMMVLLLNSFP
ncbi:piriformospora indica-insensitive protein 2 [Mercurialis annua]|uniref:piriformospora indica-insensitive protein 2 n=1 Tax=Mercurialis annua TaxID=3986 RepID=UPI00215E7CBA|nr:piriformospora indica-insensitive protein 2 [Mercurialis annua]